MKKNDRRLEEINTRITRLKAELKALEKEKAEYFESNEVLKRLPARFRNALRRYGIKSDYALLKFLDGEFIPDWVGSDRYYCAKTRKERIMSLRDLGEKTADDVIKILKEAKI